MKFSSKVEKCGQSPMRKFHPYAVAAKARGIKVYHLNIGQPDVQTPPAFFEAIRKFEQPVLEYAPSPGIPELIDAIKGCLLYTSSVCPWRLPHACDGGYPPARGWRRRRSRPRRVWRS